MSEVCVCTSPRAGGIMARPRRPFTLGRESPYFTLRPAAVLALAVVAVITLAVALNVAVHRSALSSVAACDDCLVVDGTDAKSGEPYHHEFPLCPWHVRREGGALSHKEALGALPAALHHTIQTRYLFPRRRVQQHVDTAFLEGAASASDPIRGCIDTLNRHVKARHLLWRLDAGQLLSAAAAGGNLRHDDDSDLDIVIHYAGDHALYRELDFYGLCRRHHVSLGNHGSAKMAGPSWWAKRSGKYCTCFLDGPALCHVHSMAMIRTLYGASWWLPLPKGGKDLGVRGVRAFTGHGDEESSGVADNWAGWGTDTLDGLREGIDTDGDAVVSASEFYRYLHYRVAADEQQRQRQGQGQRQGEGGEGDEGDRANKAERCGGVCADGCVRVCPEEEEDEEKEEEEERDENRILERVDCMWLEQLMARDACQVHNAHVHLNHTLRWFTLRDAGRSEHEPYADPHYYTERLGGSAGADVGAGGRLDGAQRRGRCDEDLVRNTWDDIKARLGRPQGCQEKVQVVLASV